MRTVVGAYLVAHGLQKSLPSLGFGGLHGAARSFAADGLRGGRTAALAAAVTQVGSGVMLVAGLLTPFRDGCDRRHDGRDAGPRLGALLGSARRHEYPLLPAILGLGLLWTGGGRLSVDAMLTLGSPPWPVALAGSVGAVLVAAATSRALRDTNLANTSPQRNAKPDYQEGIR